MAVYQDAHKERLNFWYNVMQRKERYDIMKQLQVVVLVKACLLGFVIPALAQEEVNALAAERGNDPVNAIVKLEVSTAKSDILCP